MQRSNCLHPESQVTKMWVLLHVECLKKLLCKDVLCAAPHSQLFGCARQAGQQAPSAATKDALYQFLRGLLTDNPSLVPEVAAGQVFSAAQDMHVPQSLAAGPDRYLWWQC